MPALVEHIIIVDGVPRTESRNVKVRMIAQMILDGGASAQEVSEQYGIHLADVHAALTYYFDHQSYFDEIDRRNDEAMKLHAIGREEWLARIAARTASGKDE